MPVSNSWLESFLHEASAWSGEGSQCWTIDSVLMNCVQGLEIGFSLSSDSPIGNGERMLCTANSVGCGTGDNSSWNYLGCIKVTKS